MALLFEIKTPLGCIIKVTKDYWDYLVSKKHPSMKGYESLVQELLEKPEEIRKSRKDDSVYLYYGKRERLYCVVAKHMSKAEGFLITAYPADKLKEGEIIWTR